MPRSPLFVHASPLVAVAEGPSSPPPTVNILAMEAPGVEWKHQLAEYLVAGQDARARHGSTPTTMSVDAQDGKGRTPLQTALWNNHVELANVLLDHGARVDLPDLENSYPLHVALSPKNQAAINLDLVKRLIDAGSPLNAYRWHGWAHFDRQNLGGDPPLGPWIDNLANDLPLDGALLPKMMDGSEHEATVIDVLTRLVKSALNDGRVRRETPLMLALGVDRADVFNALIDAGADPCHPVGRGPTTHLWHIWPILVQQAQEPSSYLVEHLLALNLPFAALNHKGKTGHQVLLDAERPQLAHRLKLHHEHQLLHEDVDRVQALPRVVRARL